MGLGDDLNAIAAEIATAQQEQLSHAKTAKDEAERRVAAQAAELNGVARRVAELARQRRPARPPRGLMRVRREPEPAPQFDIGQSLSDGVGSVYIDSERGFLIRRYDVGGEIPLTAYLAGQPQRFEQLKRMLANWMASHDLRL